MKLRVIVALFGVKPSLFEGSFRAHVSARYGELSVCMGCASTHHP